MTLASTIAAAGMVRPRAAAPLQLQYDGRRRGLAADLQDQHRRVAEAEADDPVKLVVELLPEFVHSRWTSLGRGANLALAHRGGLVVVSVWDMVSD
jgi:hypothetical protein